jgi:hypothetical protein
MTGKLSAPMIKNLGGKCKIFKATELNKRMGGYGDLCTDLGLFFRIKIRLQQTLRNDDFEIK